MSRPCAPGQPLIEALESRLMLAVTAVVSGSDLQIVGDEFANAVSISKAGNVYSLLGDVTGDFTAAGRLIINMGGGSDMVQLRDVLVGNDTTGRVADIVADMGDGNDTINLMHVRARNLLVSGGEGVNSLSVQEDAGDSSVISGLLGYIGGSGDELVIISASSVGRLAISADEGITAIQIVNDAHIGPIAFEGGSGNDLIQINASQAGAIMARMGSGDNMLALNAAHTGKVSFWADGGNDNISIYGSTCGATVLSLGEGTNNVGIHQSNDGSETPSSISGNLQILGGASDDTIAIGAAAIAGSVKALLGDGGNQLAMLQQDGGSTSLAKTLLYQGGSGSDVLSTQPGVVLGGNVTVRSGDGDDNVILVETILGSVSGRRTNLSIRAGNGAHSVSLSGVQARNLTVVHGHGGGFLTLSRLNVQSTLSGKLTYVSGDGQENVALMGASVAGAVKLTLGDGGSTVAVDQDVTDPFIGGKLTVSGGGGNDNLVLRNLYVQKGLSVLTGIGSDTANITDTVFGTSGGTRANALVNLGGGGGFYGHHVQARNLSIVTGMGDHQVTIDQGGGSGRTTLTGSLSIRLADGDDGITLGGLLVLRSARILVGGGTNTVSALTDASNATTIGGKLTLTGGAGNDSVGLIDHVTASSAAISLGDGDNSLTSTVLETAGNLSITTGGGVDRIWLFDTPRVYGSLAIRSGAGADDVRYNPGIVSRSALIDTGDGADTLQAMGSQFHGATRIRMGRGADSFITTGRYYGVAIFDAGADEDADTLTYIGATFDRAGMPIIPNVP